MKKVFWVSFLSVIFLTGCWDRKELNERALWLATGWDVGKKENIKISGQIVIPTNNQGQGGDSGASEQNYFTISEEGMSIRDALQTLQTKLSRDAFFSHRRVIFFGEEFAKRGFKKELDANLRATDTSFRADLFVVKDGEALDALKLSYPLEKPPAIAALKEHTQIGARGDTAYLSFLLAANSYGFSPTLPAVELIPSLDGEDSKGDPSSSRKIQIYGVAVFDHSLKLKGYLNREENRNQLWVMGLLKKLVISIPVDDGNASVYVIKLKSKITPVINKNNKVKFNISLTGAATLQENNTNLDLSEPRNLSFLKQKFEKQAQKQVLKTVAKVQKQYGTDIFGLGEFIHQKHPNKWKTLKNDWNKTFSKADINVNVDLKIQRIGMSGPSLLIRESEIKE